MTIEPGERLLAVGMTGMGKSKLVSYYFATYPGQRVLVDVNDDYELGPACDADGACVAREPAAIDWSKRTIRYAPSRLDEAEYEELYTRIWDRAAHDRQPLFVWLDEAEGPTSQHQAPLHMRLALGQGRKKDLTHATATLRPVEIYNKIRSQSEHAFVFKQADWADKVTLARRLGISPEELSQALDALPMFGFLHHRLGGPVVAYGPLDERRLKVAMAHVRTP